ncbi:MAG: four helix bundle protein [Candidatus Marinimicrobia bacterium]|nr:four helix bundle protein [Candidatus Neomarinimicrobiota bacterium]
MHTYSFEKLNIWREIRRLIKEIYDLSNSFPAIERFGLASQMQRAVISVASNIAEGSSRTSYKDQAHFSQIAYSSLMEVLSQIIIAHDLRYITEEKYKNSRSMIDNLAAQISSLRKTQLTKL